MASINLVNPKAELARSIEALQINVSAAQALQDVLASNLGPQGTQKMLVSGAGELKITKDGYSLLQEMHIQHPTASLIAHVAVSQDECAGDGTTSLVLLIGEILKQAYIYICEGVHPRMLTDGFMIASDVCMKVLEELTFSKPDLDRDTLISVARSSINTKLSSDFADHLSCIVVDAVLSIMPRDGGFGCIDLHMVEIMEMVHLLDFDTKLVNGLVLDHGGRHPLMPKELKDCFILVCNVSFEYEKSEVNSSFMYKSTEDRKMLVDAERKHTNAKVQRVIDLKRKVCTAENGKTFVVINQKGIDPISLEMFAEEGILALRRAKRRNMERLTKACGGEAVNSVEDLTVECLGTAKRVYQTRLNDESFTFVEDTPFGESVTILIRGPAKYAVTQIKEAVRSGLRAVKNCIDLKSKKLVDLLPGCGSVEVWLYSKLMEYKDKNTMMKEQYGLQAFANALLVIPKTLAKNGGHDALDVLAKVTNEQKKTNQPVGVNTLTGESVNPTSIGVFDNFQTKKQLILGSSSIASNLLLVDEMIKAGLSSMKAAPGMQ